jgi:hypothetical protein
MNVKQIRQRIFDQMDYSPDLQQYKDSIVRRLNDRYQELCDSAHWLWIQKEAELILKPKVTGTTGLTCTITSAEPRKVTVSGFKLNLQMEGQTFKDTDEGTSYTIVRVFSETVFFIDKYFEGVKDSAITTFEITFNRFPLPADNVEVLSYVDRGADRGKMLFISRGTEESVYLDYDNTGDPSTIVEDEFVMDEPPLGYNCTTQNSERFQAINPGYTTSSGTVPNQSLLKSGVIYEYKYTIYREGRESPPSDTVSIEFAPYNQYDGIILKGMDDTGYFDVTTNPISPVTHDSGMMKMIYRRNVTFDGMWELIDTVKSNVTEYNDVTLLNIDQFKAGYPNEDLTFYQYTNTTDVIRFIEPGPRQYVKIWYTPSADKKIHIRYHYRPKALEADNDVPVLPTQYHAILVYLTLHDVFLQMQDTAQAQIFEQRAELMKRQMRRRYLARDDEPKRFSRFDRPRRFRNIYGPPSSNFSGAN